MTAADQLLEILAQEGGRQYGGEPVSQLEHALQCATLAERAGAGASLIAAALLHDIGHLVDEAGTPEAADDHPAADLAHEARAARYLGRWFGPEVTEPVRLHVPAKRYLVATDPDYRATLSPASLHSLALQGGPMSAAQAEAFAAGAHAEAALDLRRWDDLAKVPGFPTPPLEHFRAALDTAGRR